MIGAILMIAAFVCFVLAAVGVTFPRVQLVPLGLALWVLTVLIGSVRILTNG